MRLRSAAALTITVLALLTSAANASQAVTLNDASLLAGPLSTSAALARLPHGAKVGVLWCGPELTFCLITFHARTGWVPSIDLQAYANHAGGVDLGGKGGAAPVLPVGKTPPVGEAPDPNLFAANAAPPPGGSDLQLGGNAPSGPVNPVNPKLKKP